MAVEGQILGGKYRLERFLGSGGFASVWAARNVEIDRPVALKILSDTFSTNPEFVARFVREARLSARPIHESIIRVEDIARTDGGAPFLVMELLEGETLAAAVKRRGALPIEECLEIGGALLAAMAAAHRLGIIHRDLKPANVFLTAPGSLGARVRILDLGLGKELGEEGGLTHSGQMMGTPDYMAPELLLSDQLVGSSPASDVFALGVLLFEMVAGRKPLQGLVSPTSRTSGFVERAMFYQGGGQLPRPSSVRPDVPEKLDRVVARALAVSTAERFADAGEMLAALEVTPGSAAVRELPASVPVGDEGLDAVPTVAAAADSAISGVAVAAGVVPVLAVAVNARGPYLDTPPRFVPGQSAGAWAGARAASPQPEREAPVLGLAAADPAAFPDAATVAASEGLLAADVDVVVEASDFEGVGAPPSSDAPWVRTPLAMAGAGRAEPRGLAVPATVATGASTLVPERPRERRRRPFVLLAVVSVLAAAALGLGIGVLVHVLRLEPAAATAPPVIAPPSSAPVIGAGVAPPPLEPPPPVAVVAPDGGGGDAAGPGEPDGGPVVEPPPPVPEKRTGVRVRRPDRGTDQGGDELIPFDLVGKGGRGGAREPAAPPPIPFGGLESDGR